MNPSTRTAFVPPAARRPATRRPAGLLSAALLSSAIRSAALLLPGVLLSAAFLAPAALAAQDPDPPTLEELLGLEGAEPITLTLDEALRTALDQNRELRQARFQVDEAAGQVTEAWGNVFPRIDLDASWTRNVSPSVSFLPEIFFDPDGDPERLVPVAFGLDNSWSTTLSLEQPIFEARAFVGVGAADRFEALQLEVLRGREHEIATRVRGSYYQLLLAEEQARLLERSVGRVMESLEETRALNREGLVSDYEVLRLEVELANLEPQLRQAANEALRVERALVTDLDLPHDTRVRVAGSLVQMELDDVAQNSGENRRILELTGIEPPAERDAEAVDALMERARLSSSTLQQAAINEELRHAELRAEQAEYLPRLSLFGNYQISSQQDGSPEFFGGQRGYGRLVGLQVTVPVFTGRQRGARVDQRRAVLRSAQVETERTADELRDEVENVLDRIEEARVRTRGQRLAVEQATRGFEIASAQYREGLGSRLELTDAEVALRESEFNYAEAVFDYLQARARLDELVGEVPAPNARR